MNNTAVTENKRGFMFYARIYRMVIAQDIKSKMSYRADFIISTFGMILTNTVGFMSFYILFRNFPSINRWDFTWSLLCSLFQLP